MTRWLIEKSGTGIEKSGTGIEKSGTGIEKSGTGIEKSGTGIEKSGTGIRQSFIALCVFAITFASQVSATENLSPAGAMTLVVEDDQIAVSWIIDGSVFSGVSSLTGSFANLPLTEISSSPVRKSDLKVVGGGTGTDVVGGGTGTDVVGGGTGIDVVGGGTGVDVVGGGTGVNVVGGGTGSDVVGGGTGSDVVGGGTGSDVVGGGTGSDVVGGGTGSDVVGGGTGSDVVGGGTGGDANEYANSNQFIVGGGTGSDAIVITLPGGTDMQMEVALGCNSATVSILDSNFAEVVSFNNVPVFGASGYCAGGNSGYSDFFDRKLPIAMNDRRPSLI
jgi:hypothetical protein